MHKKVVKGVKTLEQLLAVPYDINTSIKLAKNCYMHFFCRSPIRSESAPDLDYVLRPQPEYDTKVCYFNCVFNEYGRPILVVHKGFAHFKSCLQEGLTFDNLQDLVAFYKL